jgi:hypothetical protein
VAAERLRRVQARDACRVVEDKRGSAGGGEGSTNDLHPFAAFVLFSVEDAPPSLFAVVDTGGKDAGTATAGAAYSVADFLSRELRAKSREAPPKDIVSSPLGHCHSEFMLITPLVWDASIRTYSRSPVNSIVPMKKPSRRVQVSFPLKLALKNADSEEDRSGLMLG